MGPEIFIREETAKRDFCSKCVGASKAGREIWSVRWNAKLVAMTERKNRKKQAEGRWKNIPNVSLCRVLSRYGDDR